MEQCKLCHKHMNWSSDKEEKNPKHMDSQDTMFKSPPK